MSLPEPPAFVLANRSLRRFATVRTGGAAEWFARVGDEDELLAVLRWAGAAAQPVAVLGSGSNLLIADEGVRGLVLKLDRTLAQIERDGADLICGGGARLPAVAAEAARAGLSGIEFGVNIPGTVGGAVRMNANAYGGRLADTLVSVRIATGEGIGERAPGELGFDYRSSALLDGEIVARARLRLQPAEPAAVRATLGEMRARRHEAQPQGIKTFGSTFKNPDDAAVAAAAGGRAGGRAERLSAATATAGMLTAGKPTAERLAAEMPAEGKLTAGMLLSEAGCNGLRIGGARFAPKHANFVENLGEASTAEIVALMAEGRRRVHERFGIELEPEVQTLGPVRFPWAGANGT